MDTPPGPEPPKNQIRFSYKAAPALDMACGRGAFVDHAPVDRSKASTSRMSAPPVGCGRGQLAVQGVLRDARGAQKRELLAE